MSRLHTDRKRVEQYTNLGKLYEKEEFSWRIYLTYETKLFKEY